MPFYEYTCKDCNNKFDLLRPYSQADEPAQCPVCKSTNSKRELTACCAVSGSGGGGGCAGCSGGSCSSCGH